MKLWMHKIERVVDYLIPLCLAVICIILVFDIGFPKFVEDNHLALIFSIADYIVIAVFATDLTFKYIRVRNIPKFLRLYWLEIIATLPFFLVFRLIEPFLAIEGLSSATQTVQSITHEGVGLEKEAIVIAEEGSKVAERTGWLARLTKPLTKIPRFFETLPRMLHFYTKPTGTHHPSDKEFQKS